MTPEEEQGIQAQSAHLHRNFIVPQEAVHVWRIALDQVSIPETELFKILSPIEKTRATRFIKKEVRTRFIIAHSLLRKTLSLYTGIAPHQLEFVQNQYKKPALADSVNKDDLTFNLSHSENRALYAIAKGRRVGVDVEHTKAKLDCMAIAMRFFSETEIAELQRLPSTERIAAFFRIWARKEAFTKAKGQGLFMGLDKFSVSLEPEEPIALSHGYSGERWAIKNIPMGADYAAAVAAQGQEWRLELWDADGLLP
jgi:4'-phosphopantetheinyl transferase